jgi:hypothetical protein
MAAADVDVGYIAGHLGLDQPVITSLTTQPTADLVAQVLQAVAAKAHEFDNLYAEKLRTDIELENVVRSSESRSQAAKETIEKALKDVEEARKALKEEGTALIGAGVGEPPRLELAILTATPQKRNVKLSRMSYKRSKPRAPATVTNSRLSTTKSRLSNLRIGRT